MGAESYPSISPLSPKRNSSTSPGQLEPLHHPSVSGSIHQRPSINYSNLPAGGALLVKRWRSGVRNISSRVNESDVEEILANLTREKLSTIEDVARKLAALTQACKGEEQSRLNGNLDDMENRDAAMKFFPSLRFLTDTQLRIFLSADTVNVTDEEAVRLMTVASGGVDESTLATISGGCIQSVQIEEEFVVAVLGCCNRHDNGLQAQTRASQADSILRLTHPLSVTEFKKGKVLWLANLFQRVEDTLRRQLFSAHDELIQSKGNVTALVRQFFDDRVCMQAVIVAINLYCWDTIRKEGGTDDLHEIYR